MDIDWKKVMFFSERRYAIKLLPLMGDGLIFGMTRFFDWLETEQTTSQISGHEYLVNHSAEKKMT